MPRLISGSVSLVGIVKDMCNQSYSDKCIAVVHVIERFGIGIELDIINRKFGQLAFG